MSRQTHHAKELLMDKTQFLRELDESIKEIDSLRDLNHAASKFQLWKKRAENLLIRGLGEDSTQVDDFTSIQFYDPFADRASNDAWDVDDFSYDAVTDFQDGLNSAQTELLAIKEDVEKHIGVSLAENNSSATNLLHSKKVFIVHGHDETLRVKVESALHKLGLEPIVLRNQPNRFRTILEKFEDYADVGFAVILLTSDDKGYDKAKPGTEKGRARQNVVLELGYFLGKLGRNQLMAISDPDVELPGDISGVIYTDPRNDIQWQAELVRELRAAGYEVDSNKLF